MSDSRRPESARSAIELMTAWLDSPDGPPDLLIDCLCNHLKESPDELTAAVELIMGQTYLCGSLLVLLEEETGVEARKTLQQFALHYAG